MIFSEIYGAYFRTVEKLIESAINSKLNDSLFYDIINKHAFSESVVFIDKAIKNGNWLVIDKKYKTPFDSVPKMSLTVLEKRWLKTITLDKKFRLFIDDYPDWLNGIEPLFNPDDIIYPDRFSCGDNYDDENYRNIFRTILKAFSEDRALFIKYYSGRDNYLSGIYIPRKIEYSGKEDKFRLYTGSIFKSKKINIGRIINCSLSEYFDKNALLPLRFNTQEIIFKITDERNCLERVLIHFSSYKKETVQLDKKTYLVKMRCNSDDGTEILIRLMQFGQFVKVISPDYLVKEIKNRLKNQKSCK